MKKDYRRMAIKLSKANFFMGGQGHFGLSLNDQAELLQILYEKDLKTLREHYRQAHNKNMGEEDCFWYKGEFYGGRKEDYDF